MGFINPGLTLFHQSCEWTFPLPCLIAGYIFPRYFCDHDIPDIGSFLDESFSHQTWEMKCQPNFGGMYLRSKGFIDVKIAQELGFLGEAQLLDGRDAQKCCASWRDGKILCWYCCRPFKTGASSFLHWENRKPWFEHHQIEEKLLSMFPWTNPMIFDIQQWYPLTQHFPSDPRPPPPVDGSKIATSVLPMLPWFRSYHR